MASQSPTNGEGVTPTAGGSGTEIKVFLFADIRGYTRFTQERGDEAAARLAARFALVAREGLERWGGSVIELRGDEALAVFNSSRQALRAAVELQERFAEESSADPTLPLRVGIGLDAGEAVPFEGGYRGGSLNVAARLCALAAPGEVLASQEVGHLARRVEGLRFLEQGPLRLKGISQPVQVIKVVVESANPYKGLRPFDEADAPDFFGREALIEEIIARLSEPGARSRFLAIVGPSGSGKSSVVKAGVVPALRQGALPGVARCLVAEMLPGQEPMKELAAVLGRVAVTERPGLEQLPADGREFLSALDEVLPPHSELVLIVDQFEELFTMVQDEALRARFLDTLQAAVLHPASRLRCIVTLRADFYDRPLRYKAFGDLLGARTQTVTPLSAEELERAISGPAERLGIVLEPGLVAQVVAEVSDEPGALPLLQYALTELFEQRRGNTMTLEAYRAIGGVSGALVRRAEAVYRGLDDVQQQTARQLFLRLTTPVGETEVARRRVPRPELLSVQVDATAMETAIDAFGTARLLSFDRDPVTGSPTVDVSHEALIRGWPRLRGWLDEDRTGLRTHRRLTEAAQEWARLDRDPEGLYRGARLAEAREWADRNPGVLNELEEAFFRGSAEAEERARRSRIRRLRLAAAGLGTGLVIVATLAVVAFLQRGRADEQERLARSRELAATSVEQLERDPQLALLLAIEAYETAPTAQAEAAVRGALVSSPLRKVLPMGAPGFSDVSPDGKLIATGTVYGEVALWDRASGRRLEVLEAGVEPEGGEALREIEIDPGPPLESVSFSPDGKLLFAGLEGEGRIWSVTDRRVVSHLDEGANLAGGWAPDGSAILTMAAPKFGEGPPEDSPGGPEGPPEDSPGGPEGPPEDSPGGQGGPTEGPPGGAEALDLARLWDTSTGTVRAEFRGGEGGPPFIFAVLSPDGRLVAFEHGHGVRVESISTGRTVGDFEGHLFLPAPFSADGRLLVLGGLSDNGGPGGISARVFDVASGRLVRVLRPVPGLYDATLSPDGSRVLTGHIVGARIWEVESGRFVDLVGHAGFVGRVSFSPDGSRALTISEDRTARVWDAETGRLLAVLAGHSGPIFSASFTPDGRSVVTSSGGDVRVWEVGGEAAVVFREHERPVVSARFSPDGESVISAAEAEGAARVWDAGTGRQTSVLRPPAMPGTDLFLIPEFSADGRFAVTSGLRFPAGPFAPEVRISEQAPASLWDLETGAVRTEVFPPQDDPLGLCSPIEGCHFFDGALSPDGARIATVGDDGQLRIWDAADGAVRETIELWRNGAPPPGAAVGTGVEWTPDGTKVIALTGDGVVHVFDAETFEPIREFGAEVTGGLLTSLNPEVSPDGSLAAVGYPDGTARVWEIDTERPVAELPHAGPVNDVGFSSDGSFLVTASGDAPTIWDLASQRPLTRLFGHQGGVLTVDFSSTGPLIVSGSEDATARIWRCEVCAPIDQLLDLARDRVLRDLTPAERAKFLHAGT